MNNFYKYFDNEDIKIYRANEEDINFIKSIIDTIVAYQYTTPGAMGAGGICALIDDKGTVYPLSILKTEHDEENSVILVGYNKLFEVLVLNLFEKYYPIDRALGWCQGGKEDLLKFVKDKESSKELPEHEILDNMKNNFVDIISAYLKMEK